MRSVLSRVWGLPWPSGARQLAFRIVTLPGLRLIFFPHFMVGVVGVISDEHGEVLLLRHTYRVEHPWGLPTGFLEHGEQPAEALRREITEETGFVVELDPEPHVYTSRSRPIMNVVYSGSYRAGTFRPGPEISAARFFEADSLPALLADQHDLLMVMKEAAH